MEDKDGLTPLDQIIVHCYYYMQMHMVSGYHLFRSGMQKHGLRYLTNLVFVDFGCGPLTAGLSLAWYSLTFNRNHVSGNGLFFRYIGIDRSQAMLSHAEDAWAAAGGLFHKNSTRDLLTVEDAPKAIPRLITKYRRAKQELTVVLNCSYFFGSHSLKVAEVVTFISDLLTKHLAHDKVCLAFQNPCHSEPNEKWEIFTSSMSRLLTSIPNANVSETLYYHDVTGKALQGNPHRIQLRRDLLLNNVWKERLEKE
ncbi:hypothetical protein AYO44_06510 [Planctomycetaceae bacterium SCGC AG-212-F19]|nr:hypothetical protein AYO44_06510 [Planctomycetaceae bacterium SCGC AG-212-F19]